jgi:hypothetical protein
MNFCNSMNQLYLVLAVFCFGELSFAHEQSVTPLRVGTWTPVAIENGDFEFGSDAEVPTGWLFSQHAGVHAYKVRPDASVFSSGKRSLQVQRIADQVFGSVTQRVKLSPGTYRFKATLRTREVSGRQGWRLRVSVYRADGGFDLFRGDSLFGDIDWRESVVEFVVPSDATDTLVGVMLVGAGNGWIDAARLERLAQ